MFESELKLVTSVFVDLVGSLEALSHIGTQEAASLFEDCRAVLIQIAHRYSGTVGTIAGDGVLFLFGAPIASSKHAQNACLASLEMIEAATQPDWPLQGSGLRIGLSSGETLVRPVGTDIGWHYDATGVSVHVASRLQSLAKPGAILVDRLTRDLAGDGFLLEDLGPQEVRGIPTPLQIYKLATVKKMALAATKFAATPFFGRESEIAHLSRICNDPHSVSTKVVVVTGDAGIGKSRLISESWKTIASTSKCPTLFCRGFYGLVDPFSGIRECVKQLLPEEALDDIRRFVDNLLSNTERSLAPSARTDLLNLLGELFRDGKKEAQDNLDISVSRKIKTIQRGFKTLLSLWVSEGSVALLIDEFLELDRESKEIFFELMAPDSDFFGSFVLTCRSERVVELLDRDITNFEMMKLNGLRDDKAEALLNSFSAIANLRETPERTEAKVPTGVIHRSGGNPLFLLELIAAQSAISVPGSRNRNQIERMSNTTQTPFLQSIISERIDHLSKDQKQTLKVASILGEIVSEDLLSRVLSDLGHEFSSLTGLVSARILSFADTSSGRQLRFNHPLFREVAENSIVERDRVAFHVSAYRVLHRDLLAGQNVSALLRAHHAWSGHLWGAACESYTKAAAELNERAMNTQALSLLENALMAANQLEDHIARARARALVLLEMRNPLYQLGNLRDVSACLKTAKQALKSLNDPREQGRLLSFESHMLWLKGHPAAALECANQIEKIAQQSGDASLRIRAHFHSGLANLGTEQYTSSVSQMNFVIKAISAGAQDDHLGVNIGLSALAKSYSARSLMTLGETSKAITMAESALNTTSSSGDIFTHIITRMSAAVVFFFSDRMAEARENFASARTLLGSVEARLMLPIFEANYGFFLACNGKLKEGMNTVDCAIEQSLEIGLKFELGRKFLYAALCSIKLDDKKNALIRLQASLKASQESGEHQVAAVASELAQKIRSLGTAKTGWATLLLSTSLKKDPAVQAFQRTLS